MKKIIYFLLPILIITFSIILSGYHNPGNQIGYEADTDLSAAGDSLFTGIQIHNINIIFQYPNYWDSLMIYYLQGDEQYIPATVIANGRTFNNVGVRFKGNSSFTHPNNKKSFRLSFNEFVSGQKWNGLKGIHLNNCWNDPTLMREKLHLDFCKNAGIHAPRANFARLCINDTLFAFYSMIEHVDKIFLDTHYGDDSGILFKAVDGRDTGGVQYYSDFCWYGSDSTAYFDRYELKTDESPIAWGKLVKYLDTLNHTPTPSTTLPSIANLNPFYKAMTADILLGNLDSYVSTSRNFYFYFHPATNKMEWIIWDVSLTFGAMPGGSVTNVENLSVTYVSNPTLRPMFTRILNTPNLNYDYLYAFCLVFYDHFSMTKLYPKIDSIANAIRSYVYEDPRKMYTNQQFETNIISDITVAGSRKPGLKSFVMLRQNSVTSQLINLGIICQSAINPNEEPNNIKFELYQNYPNPFNPSTNIKYTLPKTAVVTVKIYDILGKEIRTLVSRISQKPGDYSLIWDGRNNEGEIVTSGTYFCRLETPEFIKTRKMTILK